MIITLQIREQNCVAKRLQATRYQTLAKVFPDFVNVQGSIHDLRPSARFGLCRGRSFVTAPKPSLSPKSRARRRSSPSLERWAASSPATLNRTPSLLWAIPQHPRSHHHFAHSSISHAHGLGTTLNRMRPASVRKMQTAGLTTTVQSRRLAAGRGREGASTAPATSRMSGSTETPSARREPVWQMRAPGGRLPKSILPSPRSLTRSPRFGSSACLRRWRWPAGK